MAGQQVVTELVIDANTSGADEFSSSMDKANSSAKSTTSSVAGVSLAIAGVGVATVAALAALRGFYDYVGTANKSLVDIAENAARAGITTRAFQQTLFAARSAGLTEKDFVSGLDKIGTDLTAASRGVTDFGKLFEANGISIKQTNGELKTAGMALTDIMGLMQKSTPDVQRAIAGIVGVSKEWIPLLRESSAEFEAQKQAAAGLGVIIDDDVIQKAKEFDREWKTAVAAWDLQFKASLGSVLPLLIQAANLAAGLLNAAGAVGGFFSRSLTSQDQWSTGDLEKQITVLQQYRQELSSVNAATSDLQKFKLDNKAGALGVDSADLASVDTAITKVQALIKTKQDLVRVPVTGGAGNAILPPTGGGSDTDAVDRAINSLRKHVEQQNADTASVDLGAAAHARFRAQAAETSAVLANGGKETAEQAKQFEILKNQAAAAADALARAKVASDIKFGSGTAFLSQGDVAIAQQLRTLYPNVTMALNSAEAAQLRFNAATRELSSAIENQLVSGLTDIVTGTTNVSDGFKNMGVAVLKALEQMIIKIAIVQPMMAALQATVSSSGILGFLGIGGSALPGTAGSALFGPIAPALHAGGIVGSEATFSRYVHPAYFDNAPKFHTGGIAGDEVPIIARKGEGVFTQGQMAAMGGGGQQTSITYAPNIDARGADAQAVARLAQALGQDRQNFERNVQAIVAKTTRNNPGAFR